MAAYVYNLAYLLLLALASPWLVWRSVRTGKYRQGWAEKFLGLVPVRSGDRPCLWLHAVSVGEVNLLASLLAEIERRGLAWECVISTTTRTGYELARKKYAGRTVFYCPLDFSWAVRRALSRVRPSCLVLAELELWPNLLAAARRRGIPVAVINGRLSERSYRGYRRLGGLPARWLAGVELVAAQNHEYADRFIALGAAGERVRITGSMKYDGARTERNNPQTKRLAALAGIEPSNVVFLAGSTQEPEEAAALETFRALAPRFPKLRLILVPRHPERFAAVATMLDASGIAWQRRSELETAPSAVPARVLLVDAVGELGAWWGTAHIAFVGGSLGNRGGQNMIEPAAYGAAVCFGPNTRNFRDIVAAMLAHDAALVVADPGELTDFVARALGEPEFATSLGHRARRFVFTQLGATRRTTDLLVPLVERGGPELRRAA